MQLNLSDIRADGGTQPRSTIDYAVVEEYAAALAEGAEFPPVTVFYDGTDYWLADGFHRREAHKVAESEYILADVRQGDRRDAVLHSVGANAAHGLRRTNEDKRRAVQKLLDDPEWSQWSDREIARRCGVSHEFARKMRPDICQSLTDRKVERGGTVYKQNTSHIGQSKPKRDDDTPAFDNSRTGAEGPAWSQSDVEQIAAEKASEKPSRDTSGDYIYTAIRQAREAMSRLPDADTAARDFPKDFWHTLTTEDARAIAEWWQEFADAWAAMESERARYAARLTQAAKEMNHAS